MVQPGSGRCRHRRTSLQPELSADRLVHRPDETSCIQFTFRSNHLATTRLLFRNQRVCDGRARGQTADSRLLQAGSRDSQEAVWRGSIRAEECAEILGTQQEPRPAHDSYRHPLPHYRQGGSKAERYDDGSRQHTRQNGYLIGRKTRAL